jgi:HEAT repeat protein
MSPTGREDSGSTADLIEVATAGSQPDATEAVIALGHLKAAEASGPLLEALQSAWHSLGGSLLEGNEDQKQYVRALLQTLPKVQASEALPFLREAYQIEEPGLKAQVALALSRLGDDSCMAETTALWEREMDFSGVDAAQAELQARLAEPPAFQRQAAFQAGMLGGLQSIVSERPAKGVADSQPRVSAPLPGIADVEEISRRALAAARDLPGLARKLEWVDLWDIARRLVELSDKRGLEALIKLYWRDDYALPDHQRDTYGRVALIRDLGRWGDRHDLPFLAWVAENDAALTDSRSTVAEVAREAIARIESRL